MNWHEKLYVGEQAGRKKKKIMRKLDRQKLVLGLYVITLASNPKNLLDVIPAYMLFRPQAAQLQIIGIAMTKEEAFEVCERIIMDVYGQTAGFDVRSFFA